MGVYVIFGRREGGGVLGLGCDLWGMRHGEVNCCYCFFLGGRCEGGEVGKERDKRGRGGRKKERKKERRRGG